MLKILLVKHAAVHLSDIRLKASCCLLLSASESVYVTYSSILSHTGDSLSRHLHVLDAKKRTHERDNILWVHTILEIINQCVEYFFHNLQILG